MSPGFQLWETGRHRVVGFFCFLSHFKVFWWEQQGWELVDMKCELEITNWTFEVDFWTHFKKSQWKRSASFLWMGKVLWRREAVSKGQKPPAPPRSSFIVLKMTLWLDINRNCISCSLVITLAYGSFMQNETLLFGRMQFYIICFSFIARMRREGKGIIFWSELVRKAQLSHESMVLFSSWN